MNARLIIAAVDMLLEKISLADARSFSSFFLDFIGKKDSLRPFYNKLPEVGDFKAQIAEKTRHPAERRQVLQQALSKQYEGIVLSQSAQGNLDALASERTFTVTTGHQLNIFTGPLYFVYKIVTVINACRRLKAEYPSYHFVPIYWMASEDHDFAEISYFYLYGKKYVWKTDQTGAVGRFNPNGLASLLNEIPGAKGVFEDAYLHSPSLSSAVRNYVNALFGDTGLLVLDADDRSLKSLFKEVIRDDLFKHTVQGEVDRTSASLESIGYKPQVHAREINLFYLDKGLRSRLETDGEDFKVVDTSLAFTRSQVESLIDKEPERFSPNVLLRPVYQETILPNLAYVGGPAEVVYWLQLKNVFERFGVPFPILMPRNFALVISAPVRKKLEKTGLSAGDFFEDKNFLFNHWVTKNSRHDLTLGASMQETTRLFQQIRQRAAEIDQTLGPLVGAEAQRALNGLEKIERKLLKAEKRLHADKLRQIEAVKDSLFPGGSLQERHDNLLDFYQQDPYFIDQLLKQFDPFDFRFNILSYE